MLGVYLEVSRVLNEEIIIDHAILGASPNPKLDNSSCGMAEIIHKVATVQHEIASAAYHSTNYSNHEVGHCACSAIKIRWPVPHPSFFWGGCSRYTPLEAGKHNKGYSCLRHTI